MKNPQKRVFLSKLHYANISSESPLEISLDPPGDERVAEKPHT
jgi:hypothetical protein